jgi:hypothetical protein
VNNPGERIALADPVFTGENSKKGMLIELRANGCHTVFPPSTHHETGEEISWFKCTEPAQADWSTLEDVTSRIAAAALLGRYWPAPGSRHAAALAMGGALARVGVPVEDATLLMRAICAASQDQEVTDRLRAVEDTYTSLVHGEPTTGWPELERILGKDKAQVVVKLREWLGSARVQIAAQTAVHGWEDPIPFAEDPVPPFPTDILPGWLADFVSALAEATQTPPDLAAMLALGTAGAALARKYRVQARPGWSQPLNLYSVTALPSATRKSAVVDEVTKPAAAFEREEAERLRTSMLERATDLRMLEGRLRSTEGAASRCKDENERARLREDARQLARELGEFQEVRSPQVIADDITPETVAKGLAELGGRLLVTSAEGTTFEIACGRYSEQAHLDNFLKAHEGDRIRVDRIGRESDYVDDPALSMVLAVQPCVIKGQAMHATIRGKGFLARWLFSLPPSPVGKRQVAPPPVPPEVAKAYHTNMLALWKSQGGVDQDGNRCVGWFILGAEADAVLQDFEAWLEPQLAEDAELGWIADWAGKLAGAVIRLAGVLHAAAGIAMGPSMPATISPGVVCAAVRLAREYLLPHALAAFGLMSADRRVADARRVIAWIRRTVNSVNSVNGVRVLSRRDIHAKILGSTYKADDVDAVTGVLLRHSYLRPALIERKTGPGRQPSPTFEVHPSLVFRNDPAPPSQNSQNSQNHADVGGALSPSAHHPTDGEALAGSANGDGELPGRTWIDPETGEEVCEL